MSACRQCIAASLARAGVIDSLEQERISSAQATLLIERSSADHDVEPASAVDRCLAAVVEHELWTICRHSAGFPPGFLLFAREADVPHVLYGLGDRGHLGAMIGAPGVAIVGARRASAYGREVAYGLGRDAADAGLTVVSGMALGIDGAAHRGALQGGGPTIAVLAGGAERPYPRSHRLLHEQIASGGCVVSESPPGFEAKRWSFVARNRIIAALAELTVFVEGTRSSGARHTVEFAEQLSLPVGAIPGPITSPMSAGPNSLLTELGVVAIRGIEDVTDVLGIERFRGGACDVDQPGSEDDELLQALLAGARDPRSLGAALPHLGAREISRRLGELELGGRLRRLSNGEYEVILAP